MSVIFKPRDGRGEKGIGCGRNLCYRSQSLFLFFFFPLILLFFDKLLGQLNSSETTAHAGLSTFFKLQFVCFKAVFTEALIKKGINLRLQVIESKFQTSRSRAQMFLKFSLIMVFFFLYFLKLKSESVNFTFCAVEYHLGEPGPRPLQH